MKLQVVVHTPMGTYQGPIDDFDKEEVEELENVMKAIASDGEYFYFEDTGKGSKVVLPKGVIQQSVFEIRKVK